MCQVCGESLSTATRAWPDAITPTLIGLTTIRTGTCSRSVLCVLERRDAVGSISTGFGVSVLKSAHSQKVPDLWKTSAATRGGGRTRDHLGRLHLRNSETWGDSTSNLNTWADWPALTRRDPLLHLLGVTPPSSARLIRTTLLLDLREQEGRTEAHDRSGRSSLRLGPNQRRGDAPNCRMPVRPSRWYSHDHTCHHL